MATDREAFGLGSLRGFTMAEGILLLVLGALALVFPVMASAWITVVVALAFLVGGIVGWVNGLARAERLHKWHCFWKLVLSTLFTVTGIWILREFGAGTLAAATQVAALAYAIGLLFLFEGVISMITALSHTAVNGWKWGLANGAVTLLLGLIIVTMRDSALLTVLGILVGISFLFSGVDLLVFSASFHDEPER